MDRLQKLEQDAQDLLDEARSLLETITTEERSAAPAEDARFSEIEFHVACLAAEHEGLKRARDLVAKAAEKPENRSVGEDRGAPAVHKDEDPFDPQVRASMGDREAAIRALDRSSLDGDQKTAVEARMKSGGAAMRAFPKHVLTFGSPAYERAFAKASLGQEILMDDEERHAWQSAIVEARAMSLTDAAGGYLIPTFLDPSVIWTLAGSQNPFRQISSVVSITGDNWNGVTSGGITMSWDTELAVVSDDTPTFGTTPITPYKLQGYVPISYEAYEDIQSAGAEIAAEFQQAKDDAEAAAFATGSGSNQPFGIVTALTGSTRQTNMATNSAISAADLFKARRHLGPRYRGNASWVMAQGYNDSIRALGTGGSLFSETVNLSAGQSGNLLDRPVYLASAMTEALNTGTNNAIVYGDFARGYKIVDRIGTVVDFIPNTFDPTTGRPIGQRGWFTHSRVGADSVNDNAFVLLFNPNTAFV